MVSTKHIPYLMNGHIGSVWMLLLSPFTGEQIGSVSLSRVTARKCWGPDLSHGFNPQRPCSFDCVTPIHHSSIYGSFISSLFTGGKYQWYLSHISMINIRGIIPVSTQILFHSSELIHHFRSTRISNTSCFPVILTSCRGEKVVGIFKAEDIGAAYSHIIHTVVHLERLQTILVEKENSRLHTHGQFPRQRLFRTRPYILTL